MTNPPLHAPDGMRAGGAMSDHADASDRALAMLGAVLPHERADDGLVHNHYWAMGSAQAGKRMTVAACFAAAAEAGSGTTTASPMRMLMDVVLPQDRHDDGLVHNHGWACSAR